MIDLTTDLELSAACAEYQQATPDKPPEVKAAIIQALREGTRKQWEWIHRMIAGLEEQNERR